MIHTTRIDILKTVVYGNCMDTSYYLLFSSTFLNEEPDPFCVVKINLLPNAVCETPIWYKNNKMSILGVSIGKSEEFTYKNWVKFPESTRVDVMTEEEAFLHCID